jgi:hypothetical protein
VQIPAGTDPRLQLTEWMTAPSNPWFSAAMVNRLWKHFLGTGLVEPADDLRATNPPSNPALWQYLNQQFVQSDFDLKHVMRLILNSRTYQLSASTLPENQHDQRLGDCRPRSCWMRSERRRISRKFLPGIHWAFGQFRYRIPAWIPIF